VAGGDSRDGSGFRRGEAHGRQYVTWGGSTGPMGESETVGRWQERSELRLTGGGGDNGGRRLGWRAEGEMAACK
jgi:hypothetical protein